MNKTVILELTEKETEVVKNALEREITFWNSRSVSDFSRILIENNFNYCNSVLSKTEKALQKQEDVLITNKDFNHIISVAKSEFNQIPNEVYLTDKLIEKNLFIHIALASSLISWFNNKNLLKRLVRFDYTDKSFENDTISD